MHPEQICYFVILFALKSMDNYELTTAAISLEESFLKMAVSYFALWALERKNQM